MPILRGSIVDRPNGRPRGLPFIENDLQHTMRGSAITRLVFPLGCPPLRYRRRKLSEGASIEHQVLSYSHTRHHEISIVQADDQWRSGSDQRLFQGAAFRAAEFDTCSQS